MDASKPLGNLLCFFSIHCNEPFSCLKPAIQQLNIIQMAKAHELYEYVILFIQVDADHIIDVGVGYKTCRGF